MKNNKSDNRQNRMIVYMYRITIFMLTLTGFAQMPIFKRYYIADIPGLGWLAAYYVTHYLHYLFAILLLALIAYALADYLMAGKSNKQLSLSGYIRIAMLTGLILTGLLLVIRNFPGYIFSPGMIVVLNISHVVLVMGLLIAGLVCIVSRKKWMLEQA